MQHFTLHLNEQFPFLGEDGRNPYVEAYLPTNMDIDNCREQKRPCLVICPGGGYNRISPREAETLALHFMPLGFHIFILHYSVAPHHFPVQLREVAAVMELIHKNEETWLCDTKHIAIMGFSAGGHLAAHYSNAYSIPQVREVFPESHGVHACVLAYPVISADKSIAHWGSISSLTGKETLTDAEQAQFSCDRLVTESTPPTFLWHTAADQLVPVANSIVYAEALDRHKVPFEVHIFPNGKHGLGTVENDPAKVIPEEAQRNHMWLELARTWLKMTFEIE